MDAQEQTKCQTCGFPTPTIELAQWDGECQTCAALGSLYRTLEKRGLVHRDLFQKQPGEERPGDSVLPASDRNEAS